MLLPPSAGVKDPASQLASRMKLAHVVVAQQSGDTERALQLLRELAEVGGEDAKLQVQVLLGDVQFEVSSADHACERTRTLHTEQFFGQHEQVQAWR